MRSADAGSNVPGGHAIPQRLTHINSHNALASGHRTLEELLTALRKGADLLKHGRLGKPKMHFFRLAEADTHLIWRSSNGKQRSITLASVFQVVPGQTSENFRRHPLPNLARASFSLLYTDTDQSVRTLDLTCRSQQEFELWYWGLHAVMERQAAVSLTAGSKPAAAFALMASAAQPALKEARSMSGPLKTPELTPQPSTKHAIGGGTVQGRITGAMGVPVPEHRPGDCYVWGSCEPKSNGSASPSSVCNSAVTCNPILVSDSSHLDVCEASVGRQHAVLVTRGGELFTWGSGHGGKLGLGHMMDAPSPQRVHTLWGQSIKHVAAGDTCTAAVSEEGSLFTWGDGAAQNLGYADVLRQVIPRRVNFGSVQQVLQVSCGPYHSAAVVSSGALFTWGDGLCGKLGHGDQQSICGPRQVEGLAGCRVLHVACGVWHTAAVAAHVPGFESLQQQGSAEVYPAEWAAIQQKMADAYDALDDEGGQLYTWGGAFEDSATKSVPLTPRLPAQKDSHQGCLGHGDKAGRLTPTRVAGALECLGVRQVECGLNLTVALTVDGRVWQMGETGVASDKQALWERALVPVQVPLPGCYVGRIAVGMQHAAALAELLEAQSPVSQVVQQASLIFTWGRGREGQLGTGVHADSAFPQPVGDLQGRQVLQIACGGYHTLAVCRHDAEREDTEERRRGYKGKMRVWFANTNASLDLAATRSASEPYGSGRTPTSASSQQTEDSSPSAYDSSSPSAGAAELRSTGRFPRKSVLKRGSFMGIRAPLALTNATDLIRRHSGDAYASSHKLLSGLRMPSPSGSETSRREAFSEGHGDSEEPLKAERRAAGPEEGNLLHGAVPLKSRPNPERRLREQQFAQEAQSTQLLHQVPDAGSANKAPAERHQEQGSHAKLENADAAGQPGAAVPLSRYLSTSQQVASALAASRAQLPNLGPLALPKHPGPGPEQEQCIQELRDRVAYLEQLVAEGGNTHTQPATLHTGFPAVLSPSPHKEFALTSPVTPSDEGRAPGGMREGYVSNQSPPPRRVLSLSPERPPLSAASPGHRSSASSRSLTLDGVSAAPLWQVNAPKQYAYAEPAQQHAAWPSAALRPSAEQVLSPETQDTPEGSCSSSSTTYGSPARSARHLEPISAAPLSTTLSEKAPASLVADAEHPKSGEASEEASGSSRAPAQRSDSAATPCSKPPIDRCHDRPLSYVRLPEPFIIPESSRLAESAAANPYSHGYPSAGPVRSPLRMNTIDVGALMGHRSACSPQQESRQGRPGSGRPISRPPAVSPCKSISGTQGSAASEVAAAADDPEVERMELLALRRELRERERRLHEREQHLQSKEAVIQATCTRIMFPGEPLPRRGAARASRTAAQTTHATQRSQGADSCPPQQPAAALAQENGAQTPMAGAQGVTAPVAREGVQLSVPTSSPQVQRPAQLPEQGITILPSPESSGISDGAPRKAGQLTARPQEAQPEQQLPHSSVDTVSLARSAHNNTELSDHMTAPQQQKEDPDHSKDDIADTAHATKKLQELEPHHSNTQSLSGSVEKQEGVQAHPIDGSASLEPSDSPSSGSSFYSPTASEPGSEASNSKANMSFSFPKPSPSQGPLEPHGAAPHSDSDQNEMLQGQDAPGKEAESACVGHTLQSPLFGGAAASPAGGEAAPQNAGASSAAAGSVMY